MKKISYEVKVGTVSLLTIIVFIVLYNFLKGKDVFRSTATYYSLYNNAGGLEESSPVEVNGHKVGVVQSIEFSDPVSGNLLVTYSVRKDFKIPVNTVAEIVPVSVLGGMKVRFVYGNGPGYYSFGDTIPGKVDEPLTDKLETTLLPIKDKIASLLTSLDTAINSVNRLMTDDFRKNINGTLENLNGTTRSLENVVSSREKSLKSTLDNVDKFSKMLADNTGKIGSTLGNIEQITDTLAAADLYGSISKLKSGLEETSKLLSNINDGKGSAGKLLTNDTLYTNLSESLESLNLLLKDLKDNPRRYVHFSLFGKKSDAVN